MNKGKILKCHFTVKPPQTHFTKRKNKKYGVFPADTRISPSSHRDLKEKQRLLETCHILIFILPVSHAETLGV